MKKVNESDADISGVMEAYHLPSPSAAVKTRVLYTARDAWGNTDARAIEISGLYPVLRFALSLAVAIGLVWGATHANQRAIAQWQPVSPRYTRPDSRSVYTAGWPRAGFRRLAAKHLQERDASQYLLQHIERLREALEQDERIRSIPKENASDRQISQAQLS